jgi:hypothetical protein
VGLAVQTRCKHWRKFESQPSDLHKVRPAARSNLINQPLGSLWAASCNDIRLINCKQTIYFRDMFQSVDEWSQRSRVAVLGTLRNFHSGSGRQQLRISVQCFCYRSLFHPGKCQRNISFVSMTTFVCFVSMVTQMKFSSLKRLKYKSTLQIR